VKYYIIYDLGVLDNLKNYTSNSDIRIIGMRNKRKGKGRGASAEGQ
jgi:hypothetical protein